MANDHPSANIGTRKVASFTPMAALKRLLSPYVFVAVVFLLLLAFCWLAFYTSDPKISLGKKSEFEFSAFGDDNNKKPATAAAVRKDQDMSAAADDDGDDDADHNENNNKAEVTQKSSPVDSDDVTTSTTTTTSSVQLRSDPLTPIAGEKLSDRWIVVTSIQPPTEDVKSLGQLQKFGWRVLVVGDLSSPPTWDAPPGVRFLSAKEAQSLGYNLLAYQRWRTYSVKNLGYLFAIQHGAKIIYDTDDDNHPVDDVRAMLQLSGHPFPSGDEARKESVRALVFDPPQSSNRSSSPLPVINTLPHFGQSSLWPRGFPLTEVARPAPRSYKMCTTRAPSWIQGVVDGDPDMDAIFRLTRKHFSTPINLTFDHSPPVVVPQRFFVQSNSQNTFFTGEALPLLFFPFSKGISFRETDIWRAYIGQPLLWLVGGRKGYVFPNAFQARNPHDYLKDFSDEVNLYKMAGQLIAFLAKWQCPSDLDFGECFVRLYEDLASEKLILSSFDVDAAKAWISDLRRMSFEFPRRRLVQDCINASDQRTVQFFPIEQPVPLPAESQLNRVVAVQRLANVTRTGGNCSLLQHLVEPVVGQDKAVLVVFVGSREPAPGLAMERLNLLYAPYFGRRVFCLSSSGPGGLKRLVNLKVTAIEANSGADCLKQVDSLRLDARTVVLLTIDGESRPLALLSPRGVEVVARLAANGQSTTLVGGCGDGDDSSNKQQTGPSIVVIGNAASAGSVTLPTACSGDGGSSSSSSSSSLSVAAQCSLSKATAAVLLDCQPLSDTTRAWLPPFCRP